MKKIGILVPLFSLPNEFGIGDFSNCAYKFIDYLDKIHYSTWQILPLSPSDKYGCPYTSVSSFAFDDIYVSLEDLKERGLIKSYETYSKSVKRVDYPKVRKYKLAYFFEAYKAFIKIDNYQLTLDVFKKAHNYVNDYAKYVVLKKINKTSRWNKWKKKDINDNEYQFEFNYEVFKQYILTRQWHAIHQYAKRKNIGILGDLPFYVGFDSSDVYSHKESFLFDKKYNPTLVAGVPPDYYSKFGQLWGNPIYNWSYLKNHNFSLMFKRLNFANKIYDITRLDHFRAFDTYYTIPHGEKTAVNGEWKLAPGYEFFDYLFNKLPDIKLVAEDLGDIREEVYILRDHYNLPGMQVIQFTLVDEEIKHHVYQYVNHRVNSVLYVSTHDSFTGMQWFESMNAGLRDKITKILDKKYGHHHIMINLFKYAVHQPANLVILFISDILRLGKSGRINVPGLKTKMNWSFRFKDYSKLEKMKKILINVAKESGRI